MKLKIFCCPECRYRKFASLNALNVHMGKMHTLDYKIFLKNNIPFVKSKKRSSGKML